MICRRAMCFQTQKWSNNTKKCAVDIASLQKLKATQEVTADALC